MSEESKAIRLSPGAAATLACLWEATAPKPGNVHPRAPFEDATYGDYVASAVVIGPIVERAAASGVGQTVLDAVRATREIVGTNTNLGTLLLTAPLAAVPLHVSLQQGIGSVLDALGARDTALVYEAIRQALAGGLGHAVEADVFDREPPKLKLVAAMRLAAERDLVAKQYTNNMADVFHGTAEWVAEGIARGWSLDAAIIHAHLRQMAAHPDSLVARKCGLEVAMEVGRRAAMVLGSGLPGERQYGQHLLDFDVWLRADAHRRNPGTSADLVTAGLFVLLREGRLNWPVQM